MTILSPSSVFPSNRDVKPDSAAQAASAATHTIVIKIPLHSALQSAIYGI